MSRPARRYAVLLSLEHSCPRLIFAAPSLEAAIASCGPGDDVVRWLHSARWWREDCALFLENFSSTVRH